MKLIIRQKQLITAINTVIKAVPQRTTMSILQCILIDASGADIHFTGNNTDLGIETKVDGEIAEHGRVCLEARQFSDIVRKINEDDDVIITTDENLNTTIESGRRRFDILSRDAAEYSYIPHIDRTNYISLSEFTLREIIQQTIFSISLNDSNQMMTGEYLKVTGNRLMLCALDGHRIAIRNVSLKDTYSDISAIIPGRSLNEISKILSDDTEKEVLVFFDENHAMFEFQDTTVVTRLIEGNYFNVAQMLSHDYETKVVINRKNFMDEIDSATTLIRESDKKPVVFRITDGEMRIRLITTNGKFKSDLPIEKTGQDLIIGFNPTFFLDALRNIRDENVTLYMVNAKSPCFIRDDEENYVYLILPVNFSSEDSDF
jgi:DNA polymerase-3 subunit beta